MFAVIRVRGPIKVNRDIELTMKLLRLTRSNHCVLYKEDSKKINGMINKARGYITWGTISEKMLEKLLAKRAMIYSKEGKLEFLRDVYKGKEAKIAEIAKDLISGKNSLEKLSIKQVFRLKPPSKGYEKKGIKKTFNEGGVLGFRKIGIDNLIKRMI
ncbi:MAG: 50S ribosomal protein L30 [archaeon]